MKLLPPEALVEAPEVTAEIDRIMMSIYRLITFSRQHLADDVLDRFLASTNELQELLRIKNAQMEAQTEYEAETYLRNLEQALYFVVEEIKHDVEFTTELQLFPIRGRSNDSQFGVAQFGGGVTTRNSGSGSNSGRSNDSE